MQDFNQAILAAAGEYLGLKEWPGARHNPKIIAMGRAIGQPVSDDETPWCASFVGAVLASLGLPHTGKLNARSYLDYGRKVSLQDARPGDICVFWRGSRSGWQGHVGFLVSIDGQNLVIRGGNQGSAVSDARFPISRLLGVRRATGARADQTLRIGSSGPDVRALQRALHEKGFQSGAIDGVFGKLTAAAVSDAQLEYGLPVTGEADIRTLEALRAGGARPPRDNADTALEGSRTIDRAGKIVAGGAAAEIMNAIDGFSSAREAAAAATREAGSWIEMIDASWINIVIAVIVLAFIAWSLEIWEFRREDHATGKHRGR